jgi:uncharacterized protein (DUF849 family)
MARPDRLCNDARPKPAGGPEVSRNVIISCALTGAADSTKLNPAVPVTPADIAREALEAAGAGAAVVHVHVRDPETGKASMDTALYREVVDRIRQSGANVLINLTTGPGARISVGADDPLDLGPATTLTRPENRVAHVRELRPDICSLDIGSFNFGPNIFVNTPPHVTRMADLIRESGVKPELEVFDLGGIRQARDMIEKGHVEPPYLFQICLGIPWAADANAEIMTTMRNQLPEGSIWAAFGISRHNFPMLAEAVVLGGHVRVGLEDNLYLARGELAPGNAALVERAVRIIENLGETVATPDEAREILGLANH